MRTRSLFAVAAAVIVFFPGPSSADKAPHQLAGFKLGENIAKYNSLLRMNTAIPLWHREYLTRVEIRELDGYKSGSIVYANCAEPGRIVRIILKYAYPEKEFFDQLLARFKQRFGEPDEWRGDPFHIIIAWKWSFRDEAKNRIGLILQHSKDEEYKLGNTVKLSNMTLLDKERSCHKNKQAELSRTSGRTKSVKSRPGPSDYRRFIPE